MESQDVIRRNCVTLSTAPHLVEMTGNGRHAFVAWHDLVTCYDEDGTTAWTNRLPAPAAAMAAGQHEGTVVVACPNHGYYAFGPNGSRALALATPDNPPILAMSRFGPFIAGNRDAGLIRYADASGAEIWTTSFGNRAVDAAITPDGEFVFVATGANEVRLYDSRGQLRWQRSSTQSSAILAVATAEFGETLFACDSWGNIHRWTLLGDELPSLETEATAPLKFSATLCGTYCLVQEPSRAVLIHNHRQGEWCFPFEKNPGEDAHAAVVSDDGERIVIGIGNNVLYLNLSMMSVWQMNLGSSVNHVAIDAVGRRFAAVTERHLHLFDVPDPSVRDFGDLQALDNHLRVRNLRRLASRTPLLGMVRWIDSFDAAISRGELSFCRQLLREMSRGGYAQQSSIEEYVRSREAAVILREAIAEARLGRLSEARRMGEEAIAIWRQVGNMTGVGQGLALLEILDGWRQSD